MAVITKILLAAMVVLLIDGALEMALIANMVSWLHRRAGGDFIIDYEGQTFPLHGKPATELADHGHASNGAAGTAVVAIGFGGFLSLYLRHRQLKTSHELRGFAKGLYNFWVGLTVVAAIYNIASLVYTFVETYRHMGQNIDIAYAATLDKAYPLEQWTPENWLTAILELSLAHGHDRSDIEHQLMLMKGWRWNLIPLSILGMIVAALAISERMVLKRRVSSGMHMQRLDKHSRQEAGSPEF